MDNFKTWYGDKKGKYILFFGFYAIFFIFFGFYLKAIRADNAKKEESKKEEVEQVEKITTYDMSDLISNDYSYKIEIIDNEEMISFSGTKSNIDYANYSNKYFLDIYNINQLLKRSKLVNSENYILSYSLENKEINELLLTDKKDGVNEIMVYVDETGKVKGIEMDLREYFEKDNFRLAISYVIGEKNENSSS